MPVKPIPDGYTSVTPYLVVKGAAQAISWYEKVFGAVVTYRMEMPEGKIGHADLKIGNAHVMIADEHPAHGALANENGKHSVSLLLYVDDVDATFPRALAAGAKQCRAVSDQFYGDRSGVLIDPFGHLWMVATHKEDLSSAEFERRAAAQQKS